MNASSVQGCPDNKRFIGIAVDYAAASFDIDIQAKESQLNSYASHSYHSFPSYFLL